jgi:SMC interacting uncharacterized protein involved in chromosome segregation
MRMPEQLLIQLLDLVQDLTGDMKSVKQDMSTLKEEVRTLKQDVETLKEDVGGLKQNVEMLKGDVGGLKQNVEMLKDDVEGLKQDVEALKQRMDKQDEELYLFKVQMDENIKMVKAIRDNQIEQRSIEDSIIHEIAHIRREMATKEDIIHIHHRLDYQISRIARTEEELHLLKAHN